MVEVGAGAFVVKRRRQELLKTGFLLCLDDFVDDKDEDETDTNNTDAGDEEDDDDESNVKEGVLHLIVVNLKSCLLDFFLLFIFVGNIVSLNFASCLILFVTQLSILILTKQTILNSITKQGTCPKKYLIKNIWRRRMGIVQATSIS